MAWSAKKRRCRRKGKINQDFAQQHRKPIDSHEPRFTREVGTIKTIIATRSLAVPALAYAGRTLPINLN